MTSLVFRALDQHVVAGLADDTAVEDERGPLSYAELTHESACVAGAISHLGVESGTEVSIDIPGGRNLAIAVSRVHGSAPYRVPRASFGLRARRSTRPRPKSRGIC